MRPRRVMSQRGVRTLIAGDLDDHDVHAHAACFSEPRFAARLHEIVREATVGAAR